MECCLAENLEECTCTYTPCERKGKCCECVRHHREKDELPACFFPPAAEKTYNRSRNYFISVYQKRASVAAKQSSSPR